MQSYCLVRNIHLKCILLILLLNILEKIAKILKVIKPEGKPIYSWCHHGDLPFCVKLEHNDVLIQTTDQNVFRS